MWNLKRSRVLDLLRKGETVFSFKTNFTCARSTEVMALAGFDCVWACMEHVPTDYSELEKIIMSVQATGSDVMVRVPRGSYSDMIKPLELDAAGILVPHVLSAADARQIARTVRFYPVGRRPADGGNSDGRYGFLPFAEYIKFANENRFVCIQIEDVEAVPELDEICSVEGIDGIFFGPGDYSQSVGVPGEIFHPEVVRVRKLVAETARRHGKFSATVGGPQNWKELAAEGFQFINLGSDVTTLRLACENVIKAVKGESAK